jgi:carnitine O-acetyltransferase
MGAGEEPAGLRRDTAKGANARIEQNYQRLVSLDPRNQSTIKSIESSIFGLSLDTYTMPPAPPSLNTDPYTRPVVDAHVRNTSSGINGGNRWFDKALTVMVETNGRAGMMGEHSPCDALIPSIVVDYALGVDVDVSAFEAGAKRENDGGGWKRCEFVLDDALRKEIGEAEARAREIVMDSDAQQLWWDRYGAEWIKKSGEFPREGGGFACACAYD